MKIVNKNLLRNSAKCYSLTKSTTSPVYANFNMQDVSDEIIGKTITLSVYVKSSGGSEALPSPSDMVGRFGIHTTEFWEDKDGTKNTTYQSTALLSSWGKDERVKATYTITRPAGKPTARTTQIALIFKKDGDLTITPSEITQICGGGRLYEH